MTILFLHGWRLLPIRPGAIAKVLKVRDAVTKTIQIQVTPTLDEIAAKAFAEILAPALRQAVGLSSSELDEKRDARLAASHSAIFKGQKPSDDQSLLIDSRQAAKLLRVSERTLWKMQHGGEMPPPIRIGRAVRWSLEVLKRWAEAGCPIDHAWQHHQD